MLRRITAKQFRELEFFEELEPAETVRADYRAALIAQVIANVNRGSKEPYKLKDFLLAFGETERAAPHRNTREQQIAAIRAIAMAYSAKAIEG